jgi:transcription elongation factor Elf1
MAFRTIAETIKEETVVTAYCGPCNHKQDLDLKALGEKLGMDYPVSHDSLVPLLRCSACGSKMVTIRLHDVYKPIEMYDTNGNIGKPR